MKFIKIDNDIINLENIEIISPSKSYNKGNEIVVSLKSGKQKEYSGLGNDFVSNLIKRLDNFNLYLR